MTEEIIIAGFGGQGVLSMGKILAYSGVMQNIEVSWMPSYGPEMRGGTANVTVIISDERISSPILNAYDTAIILNQQSMDKFENAIKPGGLLIYDPNGIVHPPETKGYQYLYHRCSRNCRQTWFGKSFQYDSSWWISQAETNSQYGIYT